MLLALLRWYSIFTFFWGIFVVCVFQKFLDSMPQIRDPRLMNDTRYPAFTRSDQKGFNKNKLLVGAIFTLPLRFGIIVFGFVARALGMRLLAVLMGTKDWSKERTVVSEKAVNWILRFCTVIAMWLFTFGRHSRKLVKLDMTKYPKLRLKPRSARASFLVSNHVAVLDQVWFMCLEYGLAFVAKASMLKVPFLGFEMKMTQCLGFDRTSPEGRETLLKELGKRNEDIQAGKRFAPLVIYPEGTTTNGKCVIEFKKGAFYHLAPIRVVGLKYWGNFHPSLVFMKQFNSFLIMLSQLDTRTECWEVDGVIEPAPGISYQEYLQEVRRIYVEDLGFQDSSNTFQEKMQFEGPAMAGGAKNYY